MFLLAHLLLSPAGLSVLLITSPSAPLPDQRYNPQHVGRASLLLQSGTVMGLRLQPYEAHVPFLLQLKASRAVWVMSHS